MTPELMQDMRRIAEFAAEMQLDPEYTYDEDIWQGGRRVLAWLDAQEAALQPIDLSKVCDAAGIDMLDAEYTAGDFLGG